MAETIKVWDSISSKFTTIEIGQKVFVGYCGSGKTVFGELEHGKLVRATSQHAIFVTDSGCTVKTKVDNIFYSVGKAAKNNIFVSLKLRNEEEFVHSNIRYYDEKKRTMVTK